MDFWQILGIEPTTDKQTIDSAYHALLQNCNPEDKPEEFMALRKAYESAVEYADNNGQPDEQPATPIDLWLERVNEVYSEWSKRVSADCWKQLLDDDVCVALDSWQNARNALVNYLMGHYELPTEIFRQIDEHFHIERDMFDLIKIFREDYIGDMVSIIRNGKLLSLYNFAPDTKGNPDEYLAMYQEVRAAIGKEDAEQLAELLEKMEQSGFMHPLTEFTRINLYLLTDKPRALEVSKQLAERYPKDNLALLARGDALFINECYAEAEEAYTRLCDNQKDYVLGLYKLAVTKKKLGKLIEAKRLTFDANDIVEDFEAARALRDEINGELITQLEQKKGAEGLTPTEQISLAWCYVQTDCFDEALELAESCQPDNSTTAIDRERLLAKTYFNAHRDYDKSLEHTELWEKLLTELPEGESHPTDKKYNATIVKAYLAVFSNDFSRAEALSQEVVEQVPMESEIHLLRWRMFAMQEKWEQSLQAAYDLIRTDPTNGSYYCNLGIAQYEQGLDQEAFNSFNAVTGMLPGMLFAYTMRARILCKHKQWEGVQEILDLLAEHKVESLDIDYVKAKMTESKDEDVESAKAQYKAIIDAYEAGNTDIYGIYEVYSSYMYHAMDELPFEQSLEIMDKGLDVRKYYPLMYNKAILLDRNDKHDEAIVVCKEILDRYPRSISTMEVLINILIFDKHDYEGALNYCDMILKLDESYFARMREGLCKRRLGLPDEAKRSFERAAEIDPDSISPLDSLADLRIDAFDFMGALEMLQRCVEIGERTDSLKPFVYRTMGRIHSCMKDCDKAIEMHRKNIELFDEEKDYILIAELYYDFGRMEESRAALEDWKQHFADTIDMEDYLWHKSDTYEYERDYKSFLRTLNEMKEETEAKHVRLARMYVYKRDYSKALEQYEILDKLRKDDDASGFARRAMYLNKLNRSNEAKVVAEEGLSHNESELGSRHDCKPLYLTRKASLLIQLGQTDQARELIDRAISLPLCEWCSHGWCKDAYVAYAELYTVLGDYEKAVEIDKDGITRCPGELNFRDNLEEIQYLIKGKLKYSALAKEIKKILSKRK